jgi:hypothetical protein
MHSLCRSVRHPAVAAHFPARRPSAVHPPALSVAVVIEWRLPKRVGGYALAHEIVELSIPVDWSGNAPTMAMRRARDRMIDAIVCRLPWTIIDMLSDAYVTARMSPSPVGLFFVDDEL